MFWKIGNIYFLWQSTFERFRVFNKIADGGTELAKRLEHSEKSKRNHPAKK
jgi:hypothetical protein